MNRRQLGKVFAGLGVAQFGLMPIASAQQPLNPLPQRSPHVVLLGDSVFDNARYVASGSSVTDHFQQSMPPGWGVSLRAVDGAVSRDVAQQLINIPRAATHLVMSVGGNDALRSKGVLEEPSSSVGHGLMQLLESGRRFEENYRAALAEVLTRKLPTIVCTIYNPQFPDKQMQKAAMAGLAYFNDCIIRAAVSHEVPVIDLRFVCDQKEDFANPIEPSSRGGQKITASIIKAVQRVDPLNIRTEIFR